jgi:putative transposase
METNINPERVAERQMPQSLSNILVHIVFSTKNREPFLSAAELRADAQAYLGGVLRTLKSEPIKTGGVADHVHLLAALPRTLTVADLVKEVKRASTHWLQHDKGLPHFHWQAGYGAFSVGLSEKSRIVNYISSQVEHHQNVSFRDEYKGLLLEHGIEFDEQYVWD